MRFIERLSDIANGYDALLCDLWGCVHDGRRVFPDAVAALLAFREGGGRVVFVTNSPRPRPAVLRQLERLGVPRASFDTVATSGDAAQAGLAAGVAGNKVWHIGPVGDRSFFDEVEEDLATGLRIERVAPATAEGIVCTGLFDDLTETPEDYRDRLAEAAARGLPMLCANPDVVVDWGERRLFCAGALGELYAEMGGRVWLFGKPNPPIYDLARRRLEAVAGRPIPDDRILAIGDGPRTDVAGALGEGMDCLFITGGIAADEFGPQRTRPDQALVADWIARQGLSATFAMPALG
jgi:HAD superfamily hydrolase (TIGR01459 family)